MMGDLWANNNKYLHSAFLLNNSKRCPIRLKNLKRKYFFNLSRNSEAYASEFLEKLEVMFPCYYMHSTILIGKIVCSLL